MATEEKIKDWTGRLLGTVETDSRGNKKVKDWTGKLLGYYDASKNITTDWCGKKLNEGNTAVSLIFTQKK